MAGKGVALLAAGRHVTQYLLKTVVLNYTPIERTEIRH